jgi:predicted MFS family arabinose efflux permease
VLLLAAVTGATVANIYYNQPVVSLIARNFGVSGAVAEQVTAATQLGYAAGIVLLLPLGDTVDRRQLILWQALALVAALVAVAAAPSLLLLTAASFAVGVAATLAQQIIPLVAELAGPERRGRVVGTVMSGLLGGILLARVISGLVGSMFGWRAVFWLGTALAAIMLALLARFLPVNAPRTRQAYGRLMASLVEVLLVHRPLRRAALVQSLLFAGFSAFWATLTLLLDSPVYGLGPAVAGLFGLIGVAGVTVAPLAGALSDRSGPAMVTRAGVLTVLFAYGVLAVVPGLAGLVLGVLLLDAGVTLSMVSQQSIILALDDGARARINTVFITALFAGGAGGTIGGSLAWHHAGWPGVVAFGAALALTALIVHRYGFRGGASLKT